MFSFRFSLSPLTGYIFSTIRESNVSLIKTVAQNKALRILQNHCRQRCRQIIYAGITKHYIMKGD